MIRRAIYEFEILDQLAANLSEVDWQRFIPRPETRDPWTIKDTLSHVTHWKTDVIRAMRRGQRPPEERGLNWTDGNRLVYLRWRDRPSHEVLAWHRQVHNALRAAPEEWFSGKDRPLAWSNDLDGHIHSHRVKDIEQALKSL